MRRFLPACLLFLSAAMLLHAEEPRWISLDGQTIPPPKSYYNGIWQTQVIEPGVPACLQLFPAAKRPALGTIIIAPGGGYENLSTSKEGSNLAAPLNAAGWDAVMLAYTVGKKDEKDHVKAQALEEAKQALTLVQKRGEEFGLSTAQVGAMGFSAGGHLMLRLAHDTAGANSPNFLMILYPGYLDKDGQLVPDVIPPKVPIFLCVGDHDLLKGSADALHKYCQEHDLACDYHVLQDVGHGFGLTDKMDPGAKDWPMMLNTFLGSFPPAKSTPAQP